jgi:mannose/fructose-specific phosphotransferase system component IIA
MARLGSRSKDEVIAGFTLQMLEKTRRRSACSKEMNKAFTAMKKVESVSSSPRAG